MEYSNCPRCGTVFLRINAPICERCAVEEESSFVKLKEYLDENPNCTMARTSKDTGISMKRILRYVQEGRLELTSGMQLDTDLECQTCGIGITIGIFCEECRERYNKTVFGMKEESERKYRNISMHTKRNKDSGKRK